MFTIYISSKINIKLIVVIIEYQINNNWTFCKSIFEQKRVMFKTTLIFEILSFVGFRLLETGRHFFIAIVKNVVWKWTL